MHIVDLEDAVSARRILSATESILALLPQPHRDYVTEVLWSGGAAPEIAVEFGVVEAEVEGAFRVFRELLLEASPECHDFEKVQSAH